MRNWVIAAEIENTCKVEIEQLEGMKHTAAGNTNVLQIFNFQSTKKKEP